MKLLKLLIICSSIIVTFSCSKTQPFNNSADPNYFYFEEHFENLDNWSNVGWTIATHHGLINPPGAKHYWFDSETSIMSINVDVKEVEDLTFSFYRYADSQSVVLELYFNDVLVWNNPSYWFGAGTHSVAITVSGSLNIKFIANGGTVYIDDIVIE